MPNERVVEIPWALSQLPQSGVILDVGSGDSPYLESIPQADRELHCLDIHPHQATLSSKITFYQQHLIGNSLARNYYDAVLALSLIEHVGLPGYEPQPFRGGDKLAVAELWALLKPGCPAIITVPAGQSKITAVYRQYTPSALHNLFGGWQTEIVYWGFNGREYVRLAEPEVEHYDFREQLGQNVGAGAIAGIIARKPRF